ncbi:MAG: TonB-dependent receptor [Gemmatimonadota bacterium]|jgi:hypothetical protein
MTRCSGRFGARHVAVSIVLAAGLAFTAVRPRPVSAQSPSTGAIEGVITDTQGRFLGSVAISVISRSSGRRLIVRTDRRGRYAALSLSPGLYDVLVERLGFQPERVEGLAVAAGETRLLSLSVEAVQGDVIRVHTRAAPAVLSAATGIVPNRWITAPGGSGLPQETGDLAGLPLLSTAGGPRMDIEGLPASAHALTIDGLAVAKRPRSFGTYTRLASLPYSFFGAANVSTAMPDVEYPGQSGSIISAQTRSGGPTPTFHAYGDFGSDATAASSGDVAGFQSYRAGGLFSGPLAEDTATFVVGLDYSRFQVPFESLWAPDAGTAGLVDAASSRGVDLSNLTGPGLAELERISGFGRLDARLGDAHRISVRGMMASLPTVVPFNAWTESPPAWQGNPSTREFFGSLMLASELSDELNSELSIGYERSETTRSDPLSATADPPATTVAALGRTFGSNERRNVDMAVWSITGRETFLVRSGDHRLKLGIAGQLPHYDLPWFYNRSGDYLFSSAADLRAGTGTFRHMFGDDKVRSTFDVRRITVFGQDTWRPRPGVEISAGARISAFRNLDSASVNANTAWNRLSALRNFDVKRQYTVFEPRFSLVMTPGGGRGVTLRASASTDADFVDPTVLAELIGNWGLLGIRQFTGSTPWPAEVTQGTAPTVTPTLTVLGPEFEGARTARLNASLSGTIGGGTALSVSAAIRRTSHLPRREDLNLAPTVAATDQYDRPIYGQLEKSGALLAAVPTTNRRFVEFDQVWGIEATGESRYVGFTVSAERPLNGAFGAWASYTWSKTEDDWLIGNPAEPLSQLSPFPHGLTGDWQDGRSDLDVPHRALAGVEFKLPGAFGPRLTALYRFQSGYPFTPGFRPGVDANADGSPVNDVAYVDNAISGVSDLITQWPCLSAQVGGFAERNACRGPNLHSLDARFALDIGLAGERSVSIVLDAVNLIATEDGRVDNALYLVDPIGSLTVSPDGRNYTVPLIANPDFGTLITRFTPQRFLRLGLRVGF